MIDYELSSTYDNMGNRIHKLNLSYYNEKGGISLASMNLKKEMMYNWVLSNKPTKQFNQYGSYCRKQKGFRLNRYRVYEILDQLPQKVKEKIHANNMPNKFFLDIEVMSDPGVFPNPSNPRHFINLNCFTDQNNNLVIQALKPLSEQQISKLQRRINDHLKDIISTDIKVKYIHYNSESAMLRAFVNEYAPYMPMITGWNFVKFDWHYIMSRCDFHNIKTKQISPTGYEGKVTIKNKWNPSQVDIIRVPKHRLIVDYMELWEKWDRSVPIKSSSKLDYAAEMVLGVKKVNYSGSLFDLYENKYEDFAFYGAIDAMLVKLIDEKIGTFRTMLAISHLSETPLSSALYASQVLEPMFQRKMAKEGVQIVRENQEDIETGKYSGGFVLQPGKGIRENIVIMDYESLFPMLILMFNIGIDSWLGMTKDGVNYTDHDGNTLPINHDTMCYTTFGTVMRKDTKSVTSKVIWDLFGGRLYNKHMANKIDGEISQLQNML
jgi:DNA polymerase elongation subunit (family B)